MDGLINNVYKRYLIFQLSVNLRVGVSVSDQLSRLHMILKPFMLRRIKKDVENELSDKVELEMIKPCVLRNALSSIHSDFVMHHTHTCLGVCPLPHCHTKPRNRPVSDAGVGRLS